MKLSYSDGSEDHKLRLVRLKNDFYSGRDPLFLKIWVNILKRDIDEAPKFMRPHLMEHIKEMEGVLWEFST